MEMTVKRLWDYITGIEKIEEKWIGERLELTFSGIGLDPHEIAWGLYNTLPSYYVQLLVGDIECNLTVPNIQYELGMVFRFNIKGTFKQ